MFEIEKPVRAAYAEVDPEHVLLLDMQYTNNSMTLAPQASARGAQMVARLADLAAGSPAHLRLLRLMSATAAFRDGIRRVNGAPALLAGTFAVTLLVSLPLSYALQGMIAAHLGSEPRGGRRRVGHQLRRGGGSSPRRRPASARRSCPRSPDSARCSTT